METSAAALATISFHPARPGKYAVWLEWAGDNGTAGNTLVLEAGPERLAWKVRSTGTWDTYRRIRIGDIILAAGGHRLAGLPDDRRSALVRGPAGTDVRLTIASGVETVGFQPRIFPDSDEKMKSAGPDTPLCVTTKSPPAFATRPDGASRTETVSGILSPAASYSV